MGGSDEDTLLRSEAHAVDEPHDPRSRISQAGFTQCNPQTMHISKRSSHSAGWTYMECVLKIVK
jgi:hypothetical protein